MRPARVPFLVVLALGLPACAAVESLFKPPPPAPPSTAVPPAPAPAPPPAARARPAPPPLPPLEQQLGEAEERRLRDSATRQIADAERALGGVQAETLEPAQRETFGTIGSFLQEARQALAARDYERASTLARKAQALAQDLPQTGR